MSQSNPQEERDDPKLRQILDSAADLPVERRPAFLEQACGGDARLCAQVKSLLLALDQADGFLSNPTVGPEPASMPTTAAHKNETGTIGPYKLLQKIGEGGMGVVYMAEQERPVIRRVAIKVIKMGMDTRQVIARFEAERQALALMDHPNIARVLDAGATETGRPYFVMELVRGVSITEYCDTNHLTTRQRLELFLPVCRAVQHAHQKGVIHRDIKPSNVLITMHDGVPVPKVIDFGIAKATSGRLTDKTLFTQYHQFVGTPQYMSPEQAEMSGLDIDTRADVYALGVLLYELLTGTTPFDANTLREAAYAEIQRIIREVEPPKPSTRLSTLGETLTNVAAHRGVEPRKLSALMRGDLDWIVMRCLEKDRTRRYETASAVAMDVQRYLKDEPVDASPPSATYKLRKFARKHRKEVAVAVAIVALLVLGVLGTSVGLIRSKFALGRAQTAEALATDRKIAAEKALEAATQAKQQAERNAARADAVNIFMRLVLAVPVRGDFLVADDIRMTEVLHEAGVLLDTELKDQPEARAEASDTLGMTYSGMGRQDEAEQLLREAHKTAVRAVGEEAEQSLGIAAHLTLVLRERGKVTEAVSLGRRTYEIARRKLGSDHLITMRAERILAGSLEAKEAAPLLEELVSKAKQKGENNEDVRATYQCYTMMPLYKEQLGQAQKMQREVIRLYDEDPRAKWAVNESGARSLYAQILQRQHKTAEAKEFYERTLASQRERLSQSHPLVVATMEAYAGFLQQIGDIRGALATQQELLEIWQKLDRKDHQSYVQGLLMTSQLFRQAGAMEDAARTQNEAFVAVQIYDGRTPTDWVEGWGKMLLTQQIGMKKDWKSEFLRTNVWCALFDHLMEKPGGTGAAVDAVNWEGALFRLERWKAADEFELISEGKFEEMRAVADPPPGIYRLSMELPRSISMEVQHAESWLVINPWEVDLYAFTPDRHGAKDQALLGTPAEHRQTSSLVLTQSIEPQQGPGGSNENYVLAASSSIELPAGTYRFSATSDDGVRLYVDGRIVIDAWMSRAPSRDDVVLRLASGAHALRVEYFQGCCGAQLWLQIAPTTQVPTAKVPVVGRNKAYERSRRIRVAALESSLTAEVNRHPTQWQRLHARANYYCTEGQFSKAADDFASAARLAIFDDLASEVSWESACVALQAGNMDNYHQQCREMLRRFGTSTDRRVCQWVVMTCTLMPDGVSSLKPVIDIADRAVGPDDFDPPELLHLRAIAKGMAQYRGGDFDSAAEWLKKGALATGTPLRTTAEVFLAMAEFRRGHNIEADAAFKMGTELLQRYGPKNGVFDDEFAGWIMALHAQREAAALLGHPLPQSPLQNH